MSLIVVSNDPRLNRRKRGTASGLQIISKEPIKYRCTVPGCDAGFYDGQERAWISHCERCIKLNEEEFREQHDIAHQHPHLFGPEGGDQEFKDWHRKNRGWRC